MKLVEAKILEHHVRGLISKFMNSGINNLMVLAGLPVSYDLFHYIFSLATFSLPAMSK